MFSILSLLNLKYVFFQRGVLPDTKLIFGLNNIINWLLFFGFTTFSAMLIFLEILNNKNNKNNLLYLGFFECFMSSISVLSRGMVFNGLALLLGYYKSLENFKIKISKKLIFKYLGALSILFFISLLIVSDIRQSKYYTVNHDGHNFFPNIEIEIGSETEIGSEIEKVNELINKKVNSLIDEINHIIFLIGGRWVGIEGVMVLINNENKSFELLKKSLNEKFALSNSFYENEIKKSYFKYSNPKNHKAYTVYTPGIVGYLYYSGSLFFIFFGIFVCASICNLIEFLAYKLSDNNYVFTAIIGNILAYRLIHFGYMPSNTYKILLVIMMNILLMKLLLIFFNKIIK